MQLTVSLELAVVDELSDVGATYIEPVRGLLRRQHLRPGIGHGSLDAGLTRMRTDRASSHLEVAALRSHKFPNVSAGMECVMDEDLDLLSREQLIHEVRKLRAAIRQHRDASGHDLCWHHPALWSLLPEPTPPNISVPAWPQFMRGCIRYRQSLDEQASDAPRTEQEFGAK